MKYLFSFLIFCFALTANGQHMFNFSDIAGGRFREKTVSGVRSMNDGEHYTVTAEGRIDKYSYKTGALAGTIFNVADHPEITGRMAGYEFSADERMILITTAPQPIYRHSYTADHWVCDIGSGTVHRLTAEGREQEAAFSPDGKRVGFVRGNNIYYVDLGDRSVHAVTEDGHPNEIINGHADWVYEEEYGFTRAFEFSPDGSSIAYLRFDERQVPEYTMEIWGQKLYPSLYTYKYPKAGERNSLVELHVYDIERGSTTKIDTGAETDQYIPRIGWTSEGRLFFYRANRLQNHFEVLLADASGKSSVLYSEQDRRYVERPNAETVTFLPRGRFLVKSERSGYMHLYVHNEKGVVTDTVTRGNWEVTGLVDVVGDRVYYMSTEGSPLRRNLWGVRLSGKGKTRLTEDEGTFRIAPSHGMKYFISYFSNASTPNLVRLHNSGGKVLRVLEDNAALRETLRARRVPKKEFFTIKTQYGNTLNAWALKPLDFDPEKKYPVLMYQYSGPGSQEVLDDFPRLDWYDVMVQEGYIVVCVDGRGTGGRGAEFRKCTYGSLGELETLDQLEAARWLASQSWVDADRIGIYGWSYGGFMALNCILKGGGLFKMAIAVAPVTSWRFYDTVYTEIYNGLPQDNPRGYDENSPINFAKNLQGRLLLVHGTADDNVHIQNTYRMAAALTAVGKQFDMRIYTDDNHSMAPGGMLNVRQMMVEYTLENL